MTIRVESEEHLADVVRAAQGPLALRGGGTRGGSVAGELLDVSGLTGVRLYEPGALTLVVGAGTPLAEIEAALAAEGQRLAFEPGDWRGLTGASGAPTIGGTVAMNISGPRRIAVGACRDVVLGVRAVDGSGTVLRNGGRVMKNVTGYDLARLMCGAHGTLGIVTEVSLKVMPVPEAAVTLVLEGVSPAEAQDAMIRAMRSPFEVSGAAAAFAGGSGTGWLRLEGFAEQVAYRQQTVRDLLARDVSVIEDADAQDVIWRGLRDVSALSGHAGDVWRVSCRPSQAAALIAQAKAERVVMDWGGGLLWLALPEGSDLRARLGVFDGHATRIIGSGTAPRFQPQPAPVAALQTGLRAAFDPRGILNPGVMG